MSKDSRRKDIDLSIEIDADAETVWKAISEGEELSRWFPLNAEIEPGVGGVIRIDWGPGCGGEGKITHWEPGRRLRYEEQWPGAEPEVPIAVEYSIESEGGKTRLRMVNSGFSADDDWADYLDTLDSGWRYFLWNLKFYLERHAGTPRRMVWQRRKISADKPEAWSRLLGSGGVVAAERVGPEAPATLWSGTRGKLHALTEPVHISASFPDLDDAVLFVELEPGSGEYSLGVWLSLYGVDESEAQRLDASLEATLDRLFPGAL